MGNLVESFFAPSLIEHFEAKIELDEGIEISMNQPVSKPGTRCPKPKGWRRKILDFRNHGGPHSGGRRLSAEDSEKDKRYNLRMKAMDLAIAEDF